MAQMPGALSGLSAAAGVLIGKRLGKKEYDAAYEESGKIMKAGLLGAVVVSGVLMLFSGSYVSFYRVDTTVQELGQSLLFIFALYAPVKIENMILGGGILKSGGDTKTVMLIDIVGTWGMGIPLCFAGAYLLKWGIVGVYALLTSEEILRLAVSLVISGKEVDDQPGVAEEAPEKILRYIQQGNDPFLAEQRSAHAERVLCFCGICILGDHSQKKLKSNLSSD